MYRYAYSDPDSTGIPCKRIIYQSLKYADAPKCAFYAGPRYGIPTLVEPQFSKTVNHDEKELQGIHVFKINNILSIQMSI